MCPKRPHIASLDQVRISRVKDQAIIEYAESDVYVTHLKLGSKVWQMTDQEILDCFNECIEATEQMRAEYDHVAVEIPLGKPQIEYFEEGQQWTPRGSRGRWVSRAQPSLRLPLVAPGVDAALAKGTGEGLDGWFILERVGDEDRHRS